MRRRGRATSRWSAAGATCGRRGRCIKSATAGGCRMAARRPSARPGSDLSERRAGTAASTHVQCLLRGPQELPRCWVAHPRLQIPCLAHHEHHQACVDSR